MTQVRARFCAIALVAVAVSGGACAQAVQPVPGVGPNLAQAQYDGYGIHQPQGLDAVTYLYSANGTWRSYTNLIDVQDTAASVPQYGEYCGWNTTPVAYQTPVGVWGLSPNCPPAGAMNPVGNLYYSLANDSIATAVPDANQFSLWQLTYQPVGTPTGISGQAFEDNSGKIAGGADQTPYQEFSQFWFDDNWIARYMSLAYGAPSPVVLYAPTTFNRWAIYGGGTTNWTPYSNSSGYIDLLCANGMYYYFTGNYSGAFTNLESALQAAGSIYDSSTQQYDYPAVYAPYYLGVMKILNEFLLESGQFSGVDLIALIQQSVSLHSAVLKQQQVTTAGVPLGWVTGDPAHMNLQGGNINTETSSVMVLSLSAAAKYTFEPGLPPTITTCTTCYQRPTEHILSAVVGSTAPNEYMTYGPYINLPVGSYNVEFYLRTGSSPSGNIANLDVYDANSGQVLGSSRVSGGSMPAGDLWTRILVPVNITNAMNQMEFRVYWYGTMNLDISAIRIH
jgi:hypothetical protein